MCEKCKEMERRCEEIVVFLKENDIPELPEDDDLIQYLIAKASFDLPGGISLLTPDGMGYFGSACYALGLKRGYEIKQLEANLNGKRKT